MNFLGVTKSILKGLGTVEKTVEPLIVAYNPALGSLVGKISSMVTNAEAQIPEDGKGPQKHAQVVGGFNDQLSLAQDFLKLGGKQLTYDADLLDAAIKAETARMNAYALLSRSVKMIDIS